MTKTKLWNCLCLQRSTFALQPNLNDCALGRIYNSSLGRAQQICTIAGFCCFGPRIIKNECRVDA